MGKKRLIYYYHSKLHNCNIRVRLAKLDNIGKRLPIASTFSAKVTLMAIIGSETLQFFFFFGISYLAQLVVLFLFPETDCQNFDNPGKCIPVEKCQVALEQIGKKKYHEFSRCGFEGFSEIICCPTASEGGKKSKQACARWSKSASVVSKYQIVGGKNAESGEFPHMAALGFYSPAEKRYFFNCGGSLISELYVLTAAHCILNVESNDLKIVRLGTVEVPESIAVADPVTDYNVANVQIHKKYDWKFKINDIALVKLEKSVSWTDTIRPACLYLKNDDPAKLYVVGWGVLGFGKSRSDVLQKAALQPRSLSDCNSTYVSTAKRHLQETQICAADLRMDACQGDSGGPLQIPEPDSSLFSIVGVISYGIGCGSKYPGIYTRVYSYLNWIEEVVWP